MSHRSSTGLTLWQACREDTWPLVLIALMPVLVSLPQVLGWLHADPVLYTGAVARGYIGGLLPGVPYIDPNNGLTTQALGYRAALDWLHGEVPWWNPYSGVGLPLAGEYQPAALFPFTLTLLLPNGVVWRHLLLQIVAGWGAYGLLRQTRCGRVAAITGGLLYAFNGTMAWFDFAAAYVVPFLPWMLLGIERAYVKTSLGLRGGWRLFAVALALNLLAGFPESAYISGLLALAWATLRLLQTDSPQRLQYLQRVAIGGIIGLLLSAPQLLAFFEFLPDAWLDAHGSDMVGRALPWSAALPSLVAPYIYGPPFAWEIHGIPIDVVTGNVGGYATLTIVLLAVYGFMVRRDALGWLLLVWSVSVLGKTFGVAPFTTLWNLVPGIPYAAFYRYSQHTWELAFIFLAMRGLDDLDAVSRMRRSAVLATLAITIIVVGLSVVFYSRYLLPEFPEHAGLRYAASASALWALFAAVVCFTLLIGGSIPRRTMLMAILLGGEAALMCAIPTLSNPRGGSVDMSAITFLREHLGLQRFYSLGPIQPNFGANFGIASINHNYIPVAQRWVSWIRQHLDIAADAVAFTTIAPRDSTRPTAVQELRRNRDAYEWVAVKYVVTDRGSGNPFVETLTSRTDLTGNIPLPLFAGDIASGTLPASLIDRPLDIIGVGVFQGNYINTANGSLQLTLCNDTSCASGAADLGTSSDNAPFDIALDRPLQVSAHTTLRYTFEHANGKSPVALWAFPIGDQSQNQELRGPAGALGRYGLQLQLRLASQRDLPQRVYADDVMDIYELPKAKPYFETEGSPCSLQASGRTDVEADCQASATLIRRELYFAGWTARVNGADAEISKYADLFQSVSLPAGHSRVRFQYAPPNIGWAWLAMWLALAVLIASGLTRVGRTERLT